MVYVQFTDKTKSEICSFFGSEPTEETPNWGTVNTNDVRYKEFFDSLPEFIRDGLPIPTPL